LNKSIFSTLIFAAAFLSGCNKDSGSSSASGHGNDNIAMVNPGRIASAMNWPVEWQKNLTASEVEVRKQIEAHIAPSRTTLDQKKAEIFAAAKLSKDQIDAISNRPVTRADMEKMGLAPKQIDELFQTASAWQNERNNAQAALQKAMSNQQAAIQSSFSEAITPVIRRVAKDKGKVAVFQDGQGVPGIIYLDASIDMTDAVIAEIQKSPSIKLTLPDLPKLEWPATQATAAIAPTTAPSAPPEPALPTTQK
jgi:Skp family chaperone for outer membrane proteins